MIAYPVMPDVPRELIRCVGRLPYDERRRRNVWRELVLTQPTPSMPVNFWDVRSLR